MSEKESLDNWKDIWGAIFEWNGVKRDQDQPEHPDSANAWMKLAGFLAYQLLPCYGDARRKRQETKAGRPRLDSRNALLGNPHRALLNAIELNIKAHPGRSVMSACKDLATTPHALPSRYHNRTYRSLARLFYDGMEHDRQWRISLAKLLMKGSPVALALVKKSG